MKSYLDYLTEKQNKHVFKVTTHKGTQRHTHYMEMRSDDPKKAVGQAKKQFLGHKIVGVSYHHPMSEDAPVNCVGTGNIAGAAGDPPVPMKKRVLRRKKLVLTPK